MPSRGSPIACDAPGACQYYAPRNSRRVQGLWLVIVAQVVVTTAAAAIWPLSQAFQVAPDDLVRPLALVLLILTGWVVLSWRVLGRTLFDPYGMFLLAALLFNAGQAYLEVFGLNVNGILDGYFPSEITARAIAMIIGAVAALHLGALLAMATGGATAAAVRTRTPPDDELNSCRLVGFALLAVSIVPAFVMTRDRMAIVYEAGYFALYQGDHATGIEGANDILASFIVPGLLFVLAGSRRRPTLRRTSIVVTAIYIFVNLFAGYRGQAAMLGAAYVWVWHRCVSPLPRIAVLLSSAVALFVVFPLVAAVRNFSGADRVSAEFLRQAYLSIDNPILAILSEMGGTLITITYTLELVPSTRSFDYGLGYLYALATAFPNLFWDLHPAVARGTPSNWLIWTVDPITARNGGGLGFSFIAEAYLNFGAVGVPVVSGVIGFLFARFVLWADGPSTPARIAAVASFTAFTLSYARGEASFIVRPLLWYAFAPYVAVRLMRTAALARLVSRCRPGRRTASGVRPATPAR